MIFDLEITKWAFGAVVAALTWLTTWYYSRRKNLREQKVEDVTSRDDLIKIINEDLVEPLRAEVADLRQKVNTLMERENKLVTFTYKLLAVLRRTGHLDQIKPEDIPEGIHFERDI